MKILLCNPNTNLPVHNQTGQLRNTRPVCPPLGVGYLAAALRKNGFGVRLYDFFDCPDAEVETVLRVESPDVVGVSCFTEHRGAALRIARKAKELNPSVHVVFGGSHASFYPEMMLERYQELDSIVMYESEETLVEWMHCLDVDRMPAKPSAGVACRGPQGVQIAEQARPIPNLDVLSFPVRDLDGPAPYQAFPAKYTLGRLASMMASRGCPYRCQFCSTTRYWGSKYRMRSVANVVDEMEFLVREKRMEYIQFFDDALTANGKWIVQLCDEIRRRRIRVDWDAITRVNYVNEEICRAMRRAGCTTVIFGVESFSDRILKTVHKGVTGAQAVESLRTAHKAGLRVTCLLMVGNPGESRESIRETAAGIKATRPDGMDVCLTAVFPKTELYDIACKVGFISDDYWLDETRTAPIFTVEHPLTKLQEFRAELEEALWASRPLVRIARGLGLSRMKRGVKRVAGKLVYKQAQGGPED